jgi:hypothetical protein
VLSGSCARAHVPASTPCRPSYRTRAHGLMPACPVACPCVCDTSLARAEGRPCLEIPTCFFFFAKRDTHVLLVHTHAFARCARGANRQLYKSSWSCVCFSFSVLDRSLKPAYFRSSLSYYIKAKVPHKATKCTLSIAAPWLWMPEPCTRPSATTVPGGGGPVGTATLRLRRRWPPMRPRCRWCSGATTKDG